MSATGPRKTPPEDGGDGDGDGGGKRARPSPPASASFDPESIGLPAGFRLTDYSKLKG